VASIGIKTLWISILVLVLVLSVASTNAFVASPRLTPRPSYTPLSATAIPFTVFNELRVPGGSATRTRPVDTSAYGSETYYEFLKSKTRASDGWSRAPEEPSDPTFRDVVAHKFYPGDAGLGGSTIIDVGLAP